MGRAPHEIANELVARELWPFKGRKCAGGQSGLSPGGCIFAALAISLSI